MLKYENNFKKIEEFTVSVPKTYYKTLYSMSI